MTPENVTENVMDVLSRYGVDIDNDLDNVLDAVARDITAVVERYDAALLADRQRQAAELAEARLELTTVHEAAAEAMRLADVCRDLLDEAREDA